MKTSDILQRLARDQRWETSEAINLMARAQGTANDTADCQAPYDSLGLPYRKASWRILPEMWCTLLSNGRLQLFLVENRGNPLGSRIVSCSAVRVRHLQDAQRM